MAHCGKPKTVKVIEGKNFFINNLTANAKDSEAIKKVHGFWVIQLKN